MTKDIDVACPVYRGAPYPRFRKKAINESKFEDGLRAKCWNATIENGVILTLDFPVFKSQVRFAKVININD